MNLSVPLKSGKAFKAVRPATKKQPISKINNFLEYWMHCIIDSMQQEEVTYERKNGISKKTFHHLQKIRRSSYITKQENFRKGYISAANEVSLTLAFLPHVDVTIGKKLLTHLGYQLNHIVEASFRDQSSSTNQESSGYGSDDSDSDCF